MTTQGSYLFLLGSARRDGNTEQLARHAAKALPKSAHCEWLYLPAHPLPPFVDIRHDPDRQYGMPEGNEAFLLSQTLAASHLVFVMPTYWYSVPADAKRYLDYWSEWMRTPGVDFKARMAGKSLSVFTTVSEEDRSVATPLVESLRLTASYMKMDFRGAVVGYGNAPGAIQTDQGAMDEAAVWFTECAVA